MSDIIGDNKKQSQVFIDKRMANGCDVTQEDINRHLCQVTGNLNAEPCSAFNGFTAEQMAKMLYSPLELGCPVQLRTLTDDEINQIPLMRQVLHLLNALNKKEIKLTPDGMLPPKMVESLYKPGGYDWSIDSFRIKAEDIIPGIKPLREVLRETGLTQTRLNNLSLTDKGKKLLEEHNELMKTVIGYMFTDFNTGWHDGMEDLELANVGRLYSLWLLHHYGAQWRDVDFYASEYFKAFPSLRKDTGSKYVTYEEFYVGRTFRNFFYFIGLCDSRDIRDPKTRIVTVEVKKSTILDMMFSFEEPSEN